MSVVVLLMSLQGAPAMPVVCADAWRGPPRGTAPTQGRIELRSQGAPEFLAPWCETLIAYLALPAPPWSTSLVEVVQEQLRKVPWFPRATCRWSEPDTELSCLLPWETVVMDVDVRGTPFPLLERNTTRRFFLRRGAHLPPPPELRALAGRLTQYLEDEGFIDAVVSVDVRAAEAPAEPGHGSRVVVTIGPTEGREMGRVTSSAPGVLSDEEARDAVEHEWFFGLFDRRFRPEIFDDDLDTLQESLRREGWPEAVVRGYYAVDPVANKVDIYIEVTPGDRLTVEYRGASEIPREVLDESLQFAEVGVVDELSCRRSAVAMRRALQEMGHHRAEVRCSLRRGQYAVHATFSLRPGPVSWIREVNIDGNRGLSDDEVRDAELVSQPRGWFNDGAWVDEVIADDATRIRALYLDRGYGDARVTPKKRVRSDGLTVTFSIEEGEQKRVAEVAIIGVPEGVDAPVNELKMLGGDPYQPGRLVEQRQAIARRLADAGYLSSVIDTQTEDTSQGVVIRHTITPGPVHIYGGVFIQGALETSWSMLQAELGLIPGEPVGLEALERAEGRLYDLRVFSSILLERLPSDPGSVWLGLDVSESETASLDLVLTFSTDDLFAIGLDARHGNLLRRAIRLDTSVRFANASEIGGAEARIGNRDDVSLALTIPHPFNVPFDVQLRGNYLRENRDTYQSRLVSGTLTGLRRLISATDCEGCPDVRVEGGYELRASEIVFLDSSIERPIDLPLDATTGSLFVEFSVRDVVTRVDPRQGYQMLSRLSFAHPILAGPLSSRSAYVMAHSQWQAFLSLGHPLDVEWADGQAALGPVVLAGGLRVGAALPFDKEGALPAADGFYYGGDQSLRGAEPRASSAHIPGAPLIVSTISELRWYFLDNLSFGAFQLAVFVDAATVANRVNELFAVTTVSVGPALRYITPVGPLSFSYGVAVVRPPEIVNDDESLLPTRGRLHFSFGAAF